MGKAPAFQFYAADYLSDSNVEMLTLEQEGAYIRLLAYCWREGSIPSDPQKAAILCKRANPSDIAPVLKLFIRKHKSPNSLIHKRLEAERAKQQKYSENMRRFGIDGANKRWGGHREAIATPMALHSSSSSIASSSSKKHLLKPTTNPPTPQNMGGDNSEQIPADLLEIKDTILEWLAYKKERRQSYRGPRGLAALWNGIRRIQAAKRRESIEWSMEKGWSGIYEKKGDAGYGKPAKIIGLE